MKEKINSQERIVEIEKLLALNHYTGLRVKELAKALETTEANISRDIAILRGYNFVETNEEGRIRLSAEFGKLSVLIFKSYKDAREKVEREEKTFKQAIE